MKKKLFLLLVVVLCFGLTGCTSDSVDKTEEDTQVVEAITQEEKEVVVTDFLCEIFTFNCNGRYDTFMQTVEGIDYLANAEISEDAIAELPDEFQVAYDTYFAGLSKYVTEDCITTMQANRIPFQLDKFVKEKGIQDFIDYIVLESVEGQENTFFYDVYFEAEGEEAYFVDPLKGQVTVEIIGEEVRVSSITITQ